MGSKQSSDSTDVVGENQDCVSTRYHAPSDSRLLKPTVKMIYCCAGVFHLRRKNMSNSKLLLITVFCSLLAGTTLIANTFTVTDESDRIYGRGVHAFFDRDYEAAVTILLQAEEIKSIDPRPYYFLGLAFLRQDKTEQAVQYFEQAAQLEYSGRAARDFRVAEALRRIQGEERLRIEKIRTEERTNAQIREQQHRESRYSSENAAGRDAIRQFAPQNQREDVAMLQEMARNLGDNAFNVRPIEPVASPEESDVSRREDAAPLGAVAPIVTETPTNSVPTSPMARTPAAPSARTPAAPSARTPAAPPTAPPRVFVNPDIPTAERDSGGNQSAADAGSPGMLTQGARERARAIGRNLGTLFSHQADDE